MIPGDRMRAAASIPGVYSIQVAPDDWGSRAEVTAQINAGNFDVSNMPTPGYPNWLETAGHQRGTMCLRWVGAKEHPDPTTRVVRSTTRGTGRSPAGA